VCVGAILLLRGAFDFRSLAGVSVRPAIAMAALAVVGVTLDAQPAIGIPVCAAVFVGLLVGLKGWPAELVPGRAAHRPSARITIGARHR
jgi:hypothetical protein